MTFLLKDSTFEQKEDEAQADVSVGEEEPKIAVEQETVVPVEIADAMEEEGEGEEGEEGYMEEEEEEVVGEEKIDTIQGLQQEIDKLLAPLTRWQFLPDYLRKNTSN